MAQTDFFKVYGASEREDKLIKVTDKEYILFFGFGKDEADAENGYRWRKDYNHLPSIEELRSDINALINSITDLSILSKFVWSNKPVWLSQENQINFKAAYDLAVQTDGANLPIRFKLGENPDGTPVYHTFTKLSSFTDFYTSAVKHVLDCINEGWNEKDGVDYQTLVNAEQ